MERFLRLLFFYTVIFALIGSCQLKSPETRPNEFSGKITVINRDTLRYLENQQAKLVVSMWGGAFKEFHLKNNGTNPLSWSLPKSEMPANNQKGAPFQGHFLCLGRWGSPSQGEIKAGLPHNGEPANSWWLREITLTENILKMRANAPLDGLEVIRTISLDENSPVFHVREEFSNKSPLGRLSNVVQHPTLGPPFLSASTIINTNAKQGFMQKLLYQNPHDFEYEWPNGFLDSVGSKKIDLRKSDSPISYVSSHLFDQTQKFGWVTATSPDTGLMLGYIWELKDYPWLNVWHQAQDGQPVAKGLEFGTTGIGKKYEDLLTPNSWFHGQPSFEYLDAGEVKTKSYTCFLTEIPKDFAGVESLVFEDEKIIITGNHSLEIFLKQPL